MTWKQVWRLTIPSSQNKWKRTNANKAWVGKRKEAAFPTPSCPIVESDNVDVRCAKIWRWQNDWLKRLINPFLHQIGLSLERRRKLTHRNSHDVRKVKTLLRNVCSAKSSVKSDRSWMRVSKSWEIQSFRNARCSWGADGVQSFPSQKHAKKNCLLLFFQRKQRLVYDARSVIRAHFPSDVRSNRSGLYSERPFNKPNV